MKKRIIFALVAVAAMAFNNSNAANTDFLIDYSPMLKNPFAGIPAQKFEEMEKPNADAKSSEIMSMTGPRTIMEYMSKTSDQVNYTRFDSLSDAMISLSKSDELLGFRFYFNIGSDQLVNLPSYDPASLQKFNSIVSTLNNDLLHRHEVFVHGLDDVVYRPQDGNFYNKSDTNFANAEATSQDVSGLVDAMIYQLNEHFQRIFAYFVNSTLKSSTEKFLSSITKYFDINRDQQGLFVSLKITQHPSSLDYFEYYRALSSELIKLLKPTTTALIAGVQKRQAFLNNLAKYAKNASMHLDESNEYFVKANDQYQDTRSGIITKIDNPDYLALQDNNALKRIADYGTFRHNYSVAAPAKSVVSDDYYLVGKDGGSKVLCPFIIIDGESTISLKSSFYMNNEYQLEVTETMFSDLESVLEEHMEGVDEEKAAEIMKIFKNRSKEIMERESSLFEKMNELLDHFFHALYSLISASSNNDRADADFINQLIDSLSDIIGSITLEGSQDNKDVTMKLKMSPVNLNIETISAMLKSTGNFEASNNAIKHALSNNYAGQSAPVETKGLFESLKLNKSSFVEFFRSCLVLSTLNGAHRLAKPEVARATLINEGRYGVSAVECNYMITLRTDPFKKEKNKED